jgi:hypothetical protein
MEEDEPTIASGVSAARAGLRPQSAATAARSGMSLIALVQAHLF